MKPEIMKIALKLCFPAQSQDLLEKQSKLIQKASAALKAENKLKLRERLRTTTQDMNRILPTSEDLLRLLPNEIWLLILKGLGSKEQANCARAYPLFDELLNGSWLFPTILPSIIGTLSSIDLTNCIIAFPEWRQETLDLVDDVIAGSDLFLESQSPFQQYYKLQDFEICSEFISTYIACNQITIESQTLGSSEKESILFGNRVVVKASEDPDFVTIFTKFLNEKGNQIRDLTIFCQAFEKLSMSSTMVYKLFCQILNKCKNMKRLCIKDLNFVCWESSEDGIIKSILSQPALGTHKCLSSLSINVRSIKALVVANTLAKKYCHQLSDVNIQVHDTPYFHVFDKFEFSKLTKFSALIGNNLEVVKLVLKLDAPNLQNLKIGLDNHVPDLNEFIVMLGRFSKLHCLDLITGKDFLGWNDQQILRVEPTNCAKIAVQTIKLDISYYKARLNFLMCFPRLRELMVSRKTCGYPARSTQYTVISYLPNSSEVRSCVNDTSSHEVVCMDQLRSNSFHNVKYLRMPSNGDDCLSEQPTDFISLRPEDKIHLASKKQVLQKPNIWKYLPSLQTFYIEGLPYTRDAVELNLRLSQKNLDKRLHIEACTRVEMSRAQLSVQMQRMRKQIIRKCRLKFTDAETEFLKEIWTPSMGTDKDLEDARNGRKEFPLLTIILKETKTQRLFKEVFPILHQHLGREGVLSCRAVCKKWQTAADSFLIRNYKRNVM